MGSLMGTAGTGGVLDAKESSRVSEINDNPPWLIDGSVGESGLKKAAGIGGTSSIALRVRPGNSRIVWRVRGGSSSTRGPRLSGSDGLRRVTLLSEGKLDMELPLRASEGDVSEDVELAPFCLWPSSPRARAKLVTDSPLSLVASEFFLGQSVWASAGWR